MDRSAYLKLRFDVVNEIATFDPRNTDSDALANSIMRLFLQASSAEQVRSQRARRDLLTFRREPEIKLPSWATTNPALASRLPTV